MSFMNFMVELFEVLPFQLDALSLALLFLFMVKFLLAQENHGLICWPPVVTSVTICENQWLLIGFFRRDGHREGDRT